MVAGRNSSRRSGDRMAVVQLLPPVALHDYRYLGANFRERERIKRKRQRWTDRLHRLLMLETAGVARRDTCGLADLPSPEMTMPRLRGDLESVDRVMGEMKELSRHREVPRVLGSAPGE